MKKEWMLGCVVVASALWMSGCASTGYEKAGKTEQQLIGLRQQLVASGEQGQAAVSSLDALVNAKGDLPPLFKDYRKQVKQFEADGAAVSKRVDAVRAAYSAYFAKWDAENAEINNAAYKQQANLRRTEAYDQYVAMEQSLQALTKVYRPFVSDLNDVLKVLSVDLTAQGVATSRTMVGECHADLKEMAGLLRTAVHQIDLNAKAMEAVAQ